MNNVLIIAGVTASGKSALADAIAAQHPSVIINADSMQLYADLPTLTARPTSAQMLAQPHALYGILPPTQTASAGWWRTAAQAAITTCQQQGRLPIVVGGTGLYIKALRHGLAPIPPILPAIRQQVRDAYDSDAANSFAQLQQVDPRYAATISATDKLRVCRALEVFTQTQRPLSDWFNDQAPPPAQTRFVTVLVMPDRALLADRIAKRLQDMLAGNAIAEVTTLLTQGVADNAPIWRVLGARQLAALIQGHCDHASALEQSIQATRQYAKRQSTWLRHQEAWDYTIPHVPTAAAATAVLDYVRKLH